VSAGLSRKDRKANKKLQATVADMSEVEKERTTFAAMTGAPMTVYREAAGGSE
jgi:hypothetical protein